MRAAGGFWSSPDTRWPPNSLVKVYHGLISPESPRPRRRRGLERWRHVRISRADCLGAGCPCRVELARYRSGVACGSPAASLPAGAVRRRHGRAVFAHRRDCGVPHGGFGGSSPRREGVRLGMRGWTSASSGGAGRRLRGRFRNLADTLWNRQVARSGRSASGQFLAGGSFGRGRDILLYRQAGDGPVRKGNLAPVEPGDAGGVERLPHAGDGARPDGWGTEPLR